jgi:hypothetical protein
VKSAGAVQRSYDRLPPWALLPPAPDIFTTAVAVQEPQLPKLPELRLLESLMADAISVALGRVAVPAIEYKDTLRWIRSGRRGEITFDECCFWLQLCPQRMRRAILGAAYLPRS